MEIFTANIEVLEKEYPSLKDVMVKMGDRPSLKLLKTRNGAYTCLVKEGDSEILLHSRFDPKKEAVRYLDSIDFEKARVILVLGVGLGYLLEALGERFPQEKRIIAVEKRMEVFHTSLFFKDWRKTLSNKKVSLIVGKDVEAVVQLVEDAPQEDIKIVEHRTSYRLSQEYYEKVKYMVFKAKRKRYKVQKELPEWTAFTEHANKMIAEDVIEKGGLEYWIKEVKHPDHIDRYNKVIPMLKGKILELGCAHGFMTAEFNRLGFKTIGIDVVERLIRYATKRYGNHYLVSMAERLPFREDEFDTVFIGELLEHVIDPELILKEAFRVLKPNAKMIITVPNNPWSINEPDHLRYLNMEELLCLSHNYISIENVFTNPHYVMVESRSRKGSPIIPEGYNPLVSILMVTYNREGYIKEAIQSVLDQTYKNIELIIVDDGSNDRTVEIIKSFNSEKINYIYKVHSGVVDSRNLSLEKAKGDFVVWVDSDDVVMPILLEKEMETFLEYPTVSVVYPNLLHIDEKSNETAKIWAYRDYSYKEMVSTLFKEGKNITPSGGAMYKREIIEKTGKLDARFVIHFDNDYLARMARFGRFKHLNIPLYKYRFHSEGISRGDLKEKNRATILMMNKMIETYPEEDLFPEINWKTLPGKKARAEFHYQIAMTFMTHGMKTFKAGESGGFFDEATKHLYGVLRYNPDHKEAKLILNKLSSNFYYDPKRYWEERGKNYLQERRLVSKKEDIQRLESSLVNQLKGQQFDSLIELGCGFGRVLKMIKTHFKEKKLCGVDIGESMIKSAKSFLKDYPEIALFVAGGEVLPFRNRAFDIALTHTMLMHVPPTKIRETILEISRIAKICQFYEPNSPSKVIYCFNHNYEEILRELGFDFEVIEGFRKGEVKQDWYIIKHQGASVSP
ncbi:MAG: methyltransferase domain-containing protein [bacterium]|nr:methyltransferase domain-containing protein [bacterium]